MTINRLSAQSVKVRLDADELKTLLPEPQGTEAPESPQMLRLIAMMLSKAETASGIPFSDLPVTVELLAAPDGGLIAYFTAQQLPPAQTEQDAVRLAVGIRSRADLDACCKQLCGRQQEIRGSMLYRYGCCWVLLVKAQREDAAGLRHLLAEYGEPFRMTAINRARLDEYGECICQKDALQYARRLSE